MRWTMFTISEKISVKSTNTLGSYGHNFLNVSPTIVVMSEVLSVSEPQQWLQMLHETHALTHCRVDVCALIPLLDFSIKNQLFLFQSTPQTKIACERAPVAAMSWPSGMLVAARSHVCRCPRCRDPPARTRKMAWNWVEHNRAQCSVQAEHDNRASRSWQPCQRAATSMPAGCDMAATRFSEIPRTTLLSESFVLRKLVCILHFLQISPKQAGLPFLVEQTENALEFIFRKFRQSWLFYE